MQIALAELQEKIAELSRRKGALQSEQTELQASLQQAQTELRHLALTSNDNQAIQAKQDEVQRLMAQSVQMRTSTLRQVAPILTPDQREKLAQLMERGGHHGRHRRQAS